MNQIFSKSDSESIQKTFRISFDANRLKIKLSQNDSIRGFNPNESEIEFKIGSA